jgi:two-component system response regulator AlgR
MDIRMPGMDGLEAARHLSDMDEPPAIIFTAAFSEHALEAYDTNAVDYLVKPIRQEKLEKALTKARKLTKAQIVALGMEKQADARFVVTFKGIDDKLEISRRHVAEVRKFLKVK